MKHLTAGQRYEIHALLRVGKNKTEIASVIGVHKSTITRELKRNSYMGLRRYYPSYAIRKAEERCRRRASNFKKYIPLIVFETARKLLEEDYSPQQIVGYCRREGIPMCSHERLYQWIWEDKRMGGSLHTHLRTRGRRYRKRSLTNNSRSKIPNRKDISERPDVVDRKERFGDYEIDTIVGASSRQHILTMVDRVSGKLWMRHLHTPTAKFTSDVLIAILAPLAKEGIAHTVTADNGVLFADHERVTKLTGIPIFFARPYHSWERGCNENTNGLIRQYIPKGSNFDDLSDDYIQSIQEKLNRRPRKRLNFLSPAQYYDLLLTQS
jgi:IS30 family transposase